MSASVFRGKVFLVVVSDVTRTADGKPHHRSAVYSTVKAIIEKTGRLNVADHKIINHLSPIKFGMNKSLNLSRLERNMTKTSALAGVEGAYNINLPEGGAES